MEELTERGKSLRRQVMDLSLQSGLSHLGGSFSVIETLIALYDHALKDEDLFVLSKGHACLPYYLMLRERGLNPKITGHPEIDPENGIHCTTGSLGHGLPISVGMAYARKLMNKLGRVYVLMSDGECQEGTTWESANLASRFKTDNLTVIVDDNKIQAFDYVRNVVPNEDIGRKFEAFGWDVERVDGHSIPALVDALGYTANGRPRAVIADTVKGRGVSYMEDDVSWHAKKPTKELLERAYEELK